MPDFNQAAPPETITNPAASTPKGAPFPAHLYKLVELAKDEKPVEGDGVLVVAWREKTPVYNAMISVADAKARDAAIDDGYSETPVVTKPDAKADKKKK